MKKGLLLFFITLSFFILQPTCNTVSEASDELSVPQVINYQGTLTDNNGKPVNGIKQLSFSLYDSETAGTKVWGPQIFSQVFVINGSFNIILGPTDKEEKLIIEAFNSSNVFLGITIGDDDGEITPRQQVLSTPFAFVAQTIADTTKLIPPGVIVMWSGSISDIPEGWILCDGENNTPDLRDKFIVGASVDKEGVALTTVKNSPMKTGGEHEHKLSIDEMPAHSHKQIFYKGVGEYPHRNGGSTGDYKWRESTKIGGDKPHENCPPFYALAYIIKK